VRPVAEDGTSERRFSFMNRKAIALVTALLGMSLLVSGCVAAVAAAGGAGGYAWSRGKLSFTTPNDITKCHKAAISGLAELDIRIVGDTTDTLTGRIKGETATGEDVTVDLESQTIRITKIDIRVGFWGNREQAELIADKILKRLH
jgi:hypothetical protein